MFFKRKQQVADYDKENLIPIIKASICNGERVAGFKNIHTGEFTEEMFCRSEADIEAFKKKYGLTEIKKEY